MLGDADLTEGTCANLFAEDKISETALNGPGIVADVMGLIPSRVGAFLSVPVFIIGGMAVVVRHLLQVGHRLLNSNPTIVLIQLHSII